PSPALMPHPSPRHPLRREAMLPLPPPAREENRSSRHPPSAKRDATRRFRFPEKRAAHPAKAPLESLSPARDRVPFFLSRFVRGAAVLFRVLAPRGRRAHPETLHPRP